MLWWCLYMTFFVYSKDRDKRITYSNTVLQTMREHQLCRNSKKYEFWFEQVVFMRHAVSTKGENNFKVAIANRYHWD